MQIIYEYCAGIDIHKKMVVVCLITVNAAGQRVKEIRSFRTTTAGLLQLHDWLQTAGCTHVAMESTGVYWRPVWNLLEGAFELLLVNAQHIKAVPGRKTDVRDAEWIADLLQHGLLTGSFIPPTEQRELRDFTRSRASVVEDRARVVNRLQKVLEDTNIKLGDVATDITGQSARAMLKALLAGQTDPAKLADLAKGKMRAKLAALEEALVGVIKPHQQFLLTELLGQLDSLDAAITRVGNEIATWMDREMPVEPEPASEQSQLSLPVVKQDEPKNPLTWTQAVAFLCTIPGISQRSAQGILAEIGIDMSRFPTAGHLASWSGMCPGNHESAGKRLSGKTRKGSPYLRQLLVEAANAAARTKNTYLSAHYHRIAARRGRKRALIAVGHTILVIIYHILSQKKSYEDLGSNYFDERDRQQTEKRLVRRLEKLGYQVQLQPVA
jgi:transposase